MKLLKVERAKNKSTTLRYRMDNILPPINNMMRNTYNNFNPNINTIMKKKELLSSDLTKKYKLDSKKFQSSINLKKQQIEDLQKKCEFIKDKNKFNNEIVNELLIKNKYKSINKNKRSSSVIDTTKGEHVTVKQYKKNKNALDVNKRNYIKGKYENENIENNIKEINENLNDIKNKVMEKKNEMNGLKNKLKIAEKDYKEREGVLNHYESVKNNLNNEIIKSLGKQINLNKEKLNEKNNIIKNNTQEIEDLKRKLEELEKLLKK